MFAVAWGANQFVSMLVAYRAQRGLSAATTDGLFGIYALALIAALLLAGPAADVWGRARVVRPAVVVSALATIVLMCGEDSVGLLLAGRFLAGAASGAIFAAGTAWVKDLSAAPAGGDEESGARRAAVALSLGFGVGPLATGVAGQWAPDPLLTAYVPHLLIVAAVTPLLWRVPVRQEAVGSGRGFVKRLRVPSVGHRRFLRVVLPAAPWVFAGPSVAFAVLPSLVASRTGGFGVAFAGVAAGLTLGVGVAVQSLTRRLDQPGRVAASVLGLLLTAAGMAAAAVAAAVEEPWLVLAAAVPLGAGYGTGLVSGLLEAQRIARPDDLAGLTAVYYALTYVGFGLPLLLAAVRPLVSYPLMLAAAAVLAVVSAALVTQGSRVPLASMPGHAPVCLRP